MKAHIGVDAESGVVHTLVTTSANVSDVTQAHALLHGEETVWHSAMPATKAWRSGRRTMSAR